MPIEGIPETETRPSNAVQGLGDTVLKLTPCVERSLAFLLEMSRRHGATEDQTSSSVAQEEPEFARSSKARGLGVPRLECTTAAQLEGRPSLLLRHPRSLSDPNTPTSCGPS